MKTNRKKSNKKITKLPQLEEKEKKTNQKVILSIMMASSKKE
jgi:hypothetical protein